MHSHFADEKLMLIEIEKATQSISDPIALGWDLTPTP